MFSKHNVKLVFIAASTLVALVLTGNARAECTQSGSPLATTVGNLKGIVTCSDLNSRVGCTLSSGTGTCSGPGFSATAQLQSNGTVNWVSTGSATVSEVFVYGTSGGNTCEYVYSGGATNGQGVGFLKSNGTYQSVQGVEFCTSGASVAKTIPNCATFSGIDGVTINCPANGAKSIIYNFEVGQPFYSASGTSMACVCNNGGAPLYECNPNVPSGQPGACPVPAAKTGVEVTTHIELNNDPYVCQTIGGSRTCFYYTY